MNVYKYYNEFEQVREKFLVIYENPDNYSENERNSIIVSVKKAREAYENARKEENEYISKNSKSLGKGSNIAGVKQSKPMNFERANSGNVNPDYNEENYEYSSNCQCCVVAYEARRRGYNVKSVKRNPLDKTEQLASRTAWAYIDPMTNKPCENENITADSPENLYNKLIKQVKKEERYTFGYNWQYEDENSGYNEIGGHIITMELNQMGELQFYDAQDGALVYGKDIINYLNDNNVLFSENYPFELLRVDDKDFNEYFINEVVEKF